MKCYISKFEANFSDWWLRHLLWNCPQLMVTGLADAKSTLGQVMAWCHQATSHYLSQCWPRSMLPYGIIRPQSVNSSHNVFLKWNGGYINILYMHYTYLHICCHLHNNDDILQRDITPLQTHWSYVSYTLRCQCRGIWIMYPLWMTKTSFFV